MNRWIYIDETLVNLDNVTCIYKEDDHREIFITYIDSSSQMFTFDTVEICNSKFAMLQKLLAAVGV